MYGVAVSATGVIRYIMLNKLDGLNPTSKVDETKAKKADLVTLPEGIKGTNCFNCRFIGNKSSLYENDKKTEAAMCNHPEVKQMVNERMCCAFWDAKGTLRSWKKD